MIDLTFFKFWLEKNYPQRKFDISPIAVSFDYQYIKQNCLHYGTISTIKPEIKLQEIALLYTAGTPVIFKTFGVVDPFAQFIGYVAYELP